MKEYRISDHETLFVGTTIELNSKRNELIGKGYMDVTVRNGDINWSDVKGISIFYNDFSLVGEWYVNHEMDKLGES